MLLSIVVYYITKGMLFQVSLNYCFLRTIETELLNETSISKWFHISLELFLKFIPFNNFVPIFISWLVNFYWFNIFILIKIDIIISSFNFLYLSLISYKLFYFYKIFLQYLYNCYIILIYFAKQNNFRRRYVKKSIVYGSLWDYS